MNPCIYSLSCPISRSVYYIGRTTRPDQRLKQHIRHSRYGYNRNKKLYSWISDLLMNNLAPVFSILIECNSHKLSKHEQHFLSLYKESGLLLNIEQLGTQYLNIDTTKIKADMKAKKIKQHEAAFLLGVSRGAISGFLNGRHYFLSVETAKRLQEYVFSI